GVEDAPVVVDLPGEFEAVADLSPVEPLVLDRAEPSLDHAVRPGRLVAGADVDDVALRGGPGREPLALEGAAVVGDDPQSADLAGLRVGEVLQVTPRRTSTSARAASNM